ncbi:hypothetical protein BZA05DRAFT_226836 [Tricharina praecox]|uniref:uncharacterized protein n=1 Tax=Tricharina praecox TaxID=43433 RepID=UPI00221E6E6F|nr:uncharacterized protein BZA05DRAFT_226836 [Tricharina praecox]KAI5856109.1 hypothetical protein BZA05DRAFT_226836 [Tricharina praecox]
MTEAPRTHAPLLSILCFTLRLRIRHASAKSHPRLTCDPARLLTSHGAEHTSERRLGENAEASQEPCVSPQNCARGMWRSPCAPDVSWSEIVPSPAPVDGFVRGFFARMIPSAKKKGAEEEEGEAAAETVFYSPPYADNR